MYQALYRKWRPRSFDEVAGQDHITRILKKQVASGHFSHAYLFTGTRGTGKTSCAKLLARAVNCQNPVCGNPCNECPSCVGLISGGIMDVVEMDAASNNGVDNVRALREEAIFTPVSVKKRVYIIDEAHMLSASAFNALLKILEEPPEHLMFILATTELHKVPATILSRCQRYSFRRLDSSVISTKLLEISKKENLRLVPGAAGLLARLAAGSMRDALSLLDQCSGADEIDGDTVLAAMGLAGNHRTAELLNAVAARDTALALLVFSGLWRDGKAADTILSELATLMRDILVSALTPGGELLSGAYGDDVISGFLKNIGQAELLFGLSSIESALAEIKSSANPRTVAELCIIGLSEPELSSSLDSLLARIERLEQGAVTGVPALEKTSAAPSPVAGHGAPSPPACSDGSEPPAGEDVIKPSPSAEKPAEETPPEPPLTAGNESVHEFWQSLQNALRGKLKIGVYNLLSDPDQTLGVFADGVLRISTTGFALNMLSAPEVSEKIKEEASALAGRAVALRFEETKRRREPEKNGLDKLMKYGNVRQID